ncbi:MAG TPA: nuclear transport factor 2 family protein, partial [Vicinamibacterales bacterium]|nr:nuclear transport factor 2 family protein [Vicinamibacterales bacterium]
ARDVRSVVRDARAELSTLSRDAAGFWAPDDEPRLPAPAIATVSLPERSAADDLSSFSSMPPRQISGTADNYTDEIPATGLAEKLVEHWRPAAIVLAVLAVVVTMIVAARSSSRTDAAVTKPQPAAAGSTASGPAPEAPATTPAATPSNASRTASANATTGGAADRAAARPVTPPTSQARPLEQTATTGVARGTTGQPAPPAVSVAPRAAAETQTAAQPNRAAPPPQDVAAAEREILERHQRWFDAFEHGDRATMASIASDNFSLVDQRPEGTPTASARGQRSIQDVRVRVTAGVGAVLSGRIAETTAADQSTVAMLSEVWIRQAEEWRLVSVRMVPLAAVATTLQ